MPTWKTRVVALLERNKRYPGTAQSRREHGVARQHLVRHAVSMCVGEFSELLGICCFLHAPKLVGTDRSGSFASCRMAFRSKISRSRRTVALAKLQD